MRTPSTSATTDSLDVYEHGFEDGWNAKAIHQHGSFVPLINGRRQRQGVRTDDHGRPIPMLNFRASSSKTEEGR